MKKLFETALMSRFWRGTYKHIIIMLLPELAAERHASLSRRQKLLPFISEPDLINLSKASGERVTGHDPGPEARRWFRRAVSRETHEERERKAALTALASVYGADLLASIPDAPLPV